MPKNAKHLGKMEKIMGKEWRRIRRICQYYHSQEWPDTHNPQSAKKKISSFFPWRSCFVIFIIIGRWDKAIPFSKTSQQSPFILMCLIITSLYFFVTFTHPRHFWYHYPWMYLFLAAGCIDIITMNHSPAVSLDCSKQLLHQKKTICNKMLWKVPKKNFSHQIQKDESWFLNGQNFNPVNPILWITKGCKINVFRELEWRFIINDLEEGTEYQQVRPSSASKWVIRCFLFLCSSHSCF